MRFTVNKWNKDGDYHVCVDDHGNEHYFDLLVAAQVNLTPEEFVGKKFECPDSAIKPYVSIVNEFWVKSNE